MSDLTITLDVKTLVFLIAICTAGAVGWATIKADTSEVRRCAVTAQEQAKEASTRLAAVERQLVEVSVTLRLKGVMP